MKEDNAATRAIDTLAKFVLVVAVLVIGLAVFAVLVMALNWLIIPVLIIGGALAWLAYRNKI